MLPQTLFRARIRGYTIVKVSQGELTDSPVLFTLLPFNRFIFQFGWEKATTPTSKSLFYTVCKSNFPISVGLGFNMATSFYYFAFYTTRATLKVLGLSTEYLNYFPGFFFGLPPFFPFSALVADFFSLLTEPALAKCSAKVGL